MTKNNRYFDKVSYWQINYNDFGNFMCEQFGFKEYEIAVLHEKQNDTSLTFYVEKDSLNKYDEEYIQNMLETKTPKNFSTGILLCKLCDEEIIEEGEYIINISW